jgi:hypothetical protein
MASVEVVLARESAELPVSEMTEAWAAGFVGQAMFDQDGVECGRVVESRREWHDDRLEVRARIELLPGRFVQLPKRGRRRR